MNKIDLATLKNEAFIYNNLIGKTNRTEVYHATLNKQYQVYGQPKEYAIKKTLINKDEKSADKESKQLQTEISMLQKVKSKFIVNYHVSF